jgi:hypothetical protein
MPAEISRPDTFQTRFFNSFVNLTRQDSTKYPAVTTIRVEPSYITGGTRLDPLTSYTIFDQYALRVWSDGSPLSAK